MTETPTLPLLTPKFGMPPKHFADLSSEERIEALKSLGLPKFRADQIARHYYGKFEADPLTMTDLPAAQREKVKEALFPTLLTPVRRVETDEGDTTKTLWRLHDGILLELSLIHISEPTRREWLSRMPSSA